MDRIRVVMLHWLNNVNEVKFADFPMVIVLVMFVLSFRDKMVICDPVVL